MSTWCLGHGGKRCPQRRHASAMLCNIGVSQLPQQVPHREVLNWDLPNPNRNCTIESWETEKRLQELLTSLTWPSRAATISSDRLVSLRLTTASKLSCWIVGASGCKLNQEEKQNYIQIYPNCCVPTCPNPILLWFQAPWLKLGVLGQNRDSPHSRFAVHAGTHGQQAMHQRSQSFCVFKIYLCSAENQLVFDGVNLLAKVREWGWRGFWLAALALKP